MKLSCQIVPHKLKVENVMDKPLVRDFPQKQISGRCEIESFVRDFIQKQKVEDVKMNLLCKISLKQRKWKM